MFKKAVSFLKKIKESFWVLSVFTNGNLISKIFVYGFSLLNSTASRTKIFPKFIHRTSGQ